MSFIISQSISDTDMNLLKYRIWDENNENNPATKWVEEALEGKINQAYKTMKTEWVPKLMEDSNVNAISASKEDFVGQVTSRSDYQTRYQQMSGSSSI
tara:strand:- start:114 stop:407 length:294 start_codon:yes stop_codon:yes gene_type:complete